MSEELVQKENFEALLRKNPCEGCPAPCCRMQIYPAVPPQNVMSVDHIRFSLLFPNSELTVSERGEFSMIKWQACSLLDQEKCKCSVHSTPKQPLTCVHFNPYNCWYKRNFVTDTPSDLCRLNLARFNKWAEHLKFDKDDKLVEAPDYKEMVELVKDIPLDHRFEINVGLVKASSCQQQ